MQTTNEFLKESKRKEYLLDSMVKLSEEHLKVLHRGGDLKEAYDGVADILSVGEDKVKLLLVGIDKKVNVYMGYEVCSHLKQKDQLVLSLGQLDNSWYLLDIDMVITPMKGRNTVSISKNGRKAESMFH
ncbi:MAG: hypothetical protein MK008_14815 [Bdellovibrionales bacterium]|nr:hypothetical protein [Bdellovibrionales bacterium]